jgi:hypothetical protein
MAELMKNISPDVQVEDEPPRPAIKPKKPKQEVIGQVPVSYSTLEDKFLQSWESLGGIALVREYRFHEERRWRFDFANADLKVAFEIQGGMYSADSGHRSFKGVQRDYEKGNAAALLGWTVFQVTSPMIKDVTMMQKFVDFTNTLCYAGAGDCQ